jgi:hypothetical protein
VRFDSAVGDGPGAAVDKEDRSIRHANRSSYMADPGASVTETPEPLAGTP